MCILNCIYNGLRQIGSAPCALEKTLLHYLFSFNVSSKTQALVARTTTPLFSNILFTNLFSIKFLHFFIISFYFNLFVSIFIQSYVNIKLHVSTLYRY